MSTDRCKSLDEALASLPRELQPARDLWPEIARCAGRSRWPLALAASLAVMSLVSALAWSVWRQHGAVALGAGHAGSASVVNTLVSFEPPQSAAYLAARAALERTFNERLQLLAPLTRSRVRSDLATIRNANADIRAALAQDPASPLLLQLLRGTWQQEIDLYTNVSQATEPMLMRRT